MADKPNTISDKDWARLQKAAARETGGLIPKTDAQQKRAADWTKQRDNPKES